MQSKAALIIVFNHRYDKNIPVLESLYEDRFSAIYFLVPFYDGDKENVIPVYESSFQFQGYFAQGFKHYFKEEYEHYLFVADDLILHPAINEDNYKEHFGLANDASFIPEIYTLHHLANNNTLRFLPTGLAHKPWYWWRLKQVIHYHHINEGIETANEMPSYEEAAQRLATHGYKAEDLSFEDVFGTTDTFDKNLTWKDKAKHFYKSWIHRKGFKLSYPIVGSYSDLVIVHKFSIKKFTHYCGVFAANGLFVEFAAPTALLLASEKLVTEPALKNRGSIYWAYTKEEADNYSAALAPYHNNLSLLLKNFPADRLYIHPIKLSKWKYATVKEKV